MTTEYIESQLAALKINKSFRAAQERRCFNFGQPVEFINISTPDVVGIIDGFAFRYNKCVYHVAQAGQLSGWYTADKLKCHSYERFYMSGAPVEKYIQFKYFDKAPYSIINNVESVLDEYAKRYLPNRIYPVGSCEDDTYAIDTKVKIYAPGIFCDGMCGTVEAGRQEINTFVCNSKTSIAIKFDTPDIQKNIIPQVIFIPKMYLKKISKNENTIKAEKEKAKIQEQTEKKSYMTTYTFSKSIIDKILSLLTNYSNKMHGYELPIAYTMELLKNHVSEESGNIVLTLDVNQDNALSQALAIISTISTTESSTDISTIFYFCKNNNY